MQRIALIIAMEDEARPLIEELGLREDKGFGDPKLPFRHYRGKFLDEIELLVSWCGKDPRHQVDNIGTEPAALSTYVTLSRFQPDLCINVGTAGGFRKRGAAIGDVYFVDQPCRFHDHRIAIPGFDRYGEGNYPVFEPAGMVEALGLKRGVVSTGNSLDFTDACLERMEKTGAVVKEMEACSVAWVAWMLGVPFMALKSVTDIVDGEHPTHEEFLRNLSHASQTIRSKTVDVLRFLCGLPV